MTGKFIGKCFCLITGSSSGFGQAVAQLLVKEGGLFNKAAEGSKIVLLSRNVDGMEETKSLMNKFGYSTDRFSIELWPVDLSNSGETEIAVNMFLKEQQKGFDNLLLFNNAGVLGDVTTTALGSSHSIEDYQKWFNVNMTSPVFLITKFCQHFNDANRIVVQTSSLAAVKPLSCMSTYCSSKAGMDMFMKCLTFDHPEVTTVSYSPGPMDTAMGGQLTNHHGNMSTRIYWKDMREKGTIVNPVDSAQKLLDTLQAGNYKSGNYFDYFGR